MSSNSQPRPIEPVVIVGMGVYLVRLPPFKFTKMKRQAAACLPAQQVLPSFGIS